MGQRCLHLCSEMVQFHQESEEAHHMMQLEFLKYRHLHDYSTYYRIYHMIRSVIIGNCPGL